MFKLSYFCPLDHKWSIYKAFATQQEAEQYVNAYPRFGHVLSSFIRQGTYKIISA